MRKGTMRPAQCVYCGKATWVDRDNRLVAHFKPMPGHMACKEGKWAVNTIEAKEARR